MKDVTPMLNLKERNTKTPTNRILRLLAEDAGRKTANPAGFAQSTGRSARRTS